MYINDDNTDNSDSYKFKSKLHYNFQSINPLWPQALCRTHDHTVNCGQTITVLVVMGNLLWWEDGFVSFLVSYHCPE